MPQVSPEDIAAGLGRAGRSQLCGFLALIEAARASALLAGLSREVRTRLGKPVEPATAGLQRRTAELEAGPLSEDALRLQLWTEMTEALARGGVLPFSLRKLRRDSAALGLGAAQTLRAKAEPQAFPDIVAAEMAAMVTTLAQSGGLDPELAAVLDKGQAAIRTATLAGGGWAAFAAAVGSAGFAPYLLAAKVAGALPFVTGPALVSLLAVAVNPLTVVAGTAALGWWVTQGAAGQARRVAAARIAVLLALEGMADRDGGLGSLVESFRRCASLPKGQRPEAVAARDAEIRAVIGRMPRARRPDRRWRAELPLAEVAGTAGLTLAQVLLDAAAIDPRVLAAADFSRRLDLDSPMDLAAQISSFATRGAEISLRGYTAERLVMAQLTAAGHAVSLPATSNMPGFDLLVDGLPVQVKCGAHLSLLTEHFARYPDIPVIADHGLMRLAQEAGAPWADQVGTVDGFDLDHVEGLVHHTLNAAEGMAHPDVPLFAMLVAGWRGARQVQAGAIALEDLPAWALVNLSIRGVLSASGQVGGQALGLLVLGPAGALVLGPVMGVAALFGTGWVQGKVDLALRGAWAEEVLSAARSLRAAMEAGLRRRIEALSARQARLQAAASGLGWVEDALADDLVAAVEALLDLPPATSLPNALELLVASVEMRALDGEMRAARGRLEAALADRPTTMDVFSRLHADVWQRFAAGR